MKGARRGALLGVAILLAVIFGAVAYQALARTGRLPTPSPRTASVLPRIDTYLEQQWGQSGHVNGPESSTYSMFCAVRFLGDSKGSLRFDVYVWEACQAYRRTSHGLAKGTGFSVPAVITVKRTAQGLVPIADRQPRDAPYYANDIRRLFPQAAEVAIEHLTGGDGVGGMFAALEERAQRELPIKG
jgi:hypothetical protein